MTIGERLQQPGLTAEEHGRIIAERNALVVKWLNWGRRCVNDMRRRSFDVRRLEDDDATQIAFDLMLWAAESYDPERGLKFARYVWMVIRTQLPRRCRYVSNLIYVPPTATQWAGTKEYATRAFQVSSLDAVAMRYREQGIVWEPPDRETVPVDDRMDTADEMNRIREAISRLQPDKLRQVAEARLLRGLSFSEIGREMGVTKQRIQQMHPNMMRELRRILDVEGR